MHVKEERNEGDGERNHNSLGRSEEKLTFPGDIQDSLLRALPTSSHFVFTTV